MKLNRLVIAIELAVGISAGLGSMSTTAQAASSYITPVAMRGTWYGYSKEYGFWSKIHVTKHSFTYSSSGSRETIKGHHLLVVRGHYKGHTLVTFQDRHHIGATDSYYFGEAIVNGHKKTALIMDYDIAMFHYHVKHYKVVK